MVLRTLSRLRAFAGPRTLLFGVYLSVMVGLFALASQTAGHLAAMAMHWAPMAAPAATSKPALQKAAMRTPRPPTEGSVTLAQSWFGRDRGSWRERSYRRDRSDWDDESDWRDRRRREDWRWDNDDDDRPEPRQGRGSGTYRTVCVRLCDGFYWPMSYATTPEYFDRDQRKCESSCGSPARLYKYRTSDGDPDSMEDLNGQPYSRLNTAFLYRTRYDANCKCKADPWSAEARQTHQVYALEAAKAKGDKEAARELSALQDSLQAARKLSQAPGAAGPSGAAGDDSLSSATTTASEAAPEPRPASVPARGRMSLGTRSEPAPSAPARSVTGIWRNRSDNAP